METDLTPAQHDRLDKISDDHKVVGWNEETRGPIIRKPDGGHVVLRRDGVALA